MVDANEFKNKAEEFKGKAEQFKGKDFLDSVKSKFNK